MQSLPHLTPFAPVLVVLGAAGLGGVAWQFLPHKLRTILTNGLQHVWTAFVIGAALVVHASFVVARFVGQL